MEVAPTAEITLEELQLAARNHGMPLEALRYSITPVGLHYLLIHFDIPHVDAGTWRLRLGGRVERPLELSLEVVFTGLDRGVQGDVEQAYERSLPLAEAMREELLLAYAVNGQPLPPQHGFPLRLVVPGWYGMTHVKWLQSITVVDEPFRGWQQDVSYHLRASEDEQGTPVTRILPRALLIPPGIPEFLSRSRIVDSGPCAVEGRAWSGWAPVERVEVSLDGGESWDDAALDEPLSDFAWRGWTYRWEAEPGEYELCCRATDAAGNTQPAAPEWNYDGFCNNALQRVRVTVR